MFLSILLVALFAQVPNPAESIVNRAYQQLREKNYEAAVELFQQALDQDASLILVHRELGYTFQKMGEPAKAVAAFEAYARVRPDDCQNLLDLAYVSFEIKQEARALELFRRVEAGGTPQQAAQARQALEATGLPMREEIARWSAVVASDPGNLDARESLADAYCRHGDRDLAAAQFQELRRRAPERLRHLVSLAHIYQGRDEGNAYALLAWRSTEPRVAAAGREAFGDRYPYAPEFEQALQLEPWHDDVRKEVAYLYLEVGRPKEALPHFEWLAAHNPADTKSAEQVEEVRAQLGLLPLQEQIRRHKRMGYANLEKSYLPAAAAELEAAHCLDPQDGRVALDLGNIYNTLHRDDVALVWFRVAQSSPDTAVARKARQAVHNLTQDERKTVTTVWAMPFWSTRFGSVFGYGQVKSEWRTSRLPFRPYLSVRFIGDSKTRTGGTSPLILSDDGTITAVGVQARLAKNLFAWAEAGNAVSGLDRRPQGLQRSEPDYRGGLAFAKNWGPTLFSRERGLFSDTSVDAVYLSRFGHNGIAYLQTKSGYQLPPFHGLFHQPMLLVNLFGDVRRDYFNNVLEVGPGYRVGLDRFNRLNAYVAVVRGIYTTQGARSQNSGRPNYVDVRLVLWYSKSF